MISGLVEAGDPITLAIKKSAGFLCLQTDRLRFLDITNFLAAGVSYSNYLKAFEVEEIKLWFPHEAWQGSLDFLKRRTFPEHAEFYSTLKGCNITDEEYRLCFDMWQREGMTTMEDLLVKYCNADCIGEFDLG